MPGLHLAHGLFVAVCGLPVVAARRGYFPAAVSRLLTAVAAPVAERGLQSMQASAVVT